jgi:hypothetical protein
LNFILPLPKSSAINPETAGGHIFLVGDVDTYSKDLAPPVALVPVKNNQITIHIIINPICGVEFLNPSKRLAILYNFR